MGAIAILGELTNTARSTSGEVAGLSSRSGSNPTRVTDITNGLVRRNGALTCNQGDRVRFPARPLT
jgi:hypothetical protein